MPLSEKAIQYTLCSEKTHPLTFSFLSPLCDVQI